MKEQIWEVFSECKEDASLYIQSWHWWAIALKVFSGPASSATLPLQPWNPIPGERPISLAMEVQEEMEKGEVHRDSLGRERQRRRRRLWRFQERPGEEEPRTIQVGSQSR